MTTYGIWNEPTNPSFWRGPEATPARYMRLYLAARAAIKAADPSARAATAGILDSGSVDGSAFLRAMLDSAPSARGQIDAIGWHPYVGNVEQIIGSVAGARAVLEQRGLASVPIEISEVGWSARGGFTPVQRAAMLRTLAAQLPYERLNVTRLLPYVWTGDPAWQITALDGSPGLRRRRILRRHPRCPRAPPCRAGCEGQAQGAEGSQELPPPHPPLRDAEGQEHAQVRVDRRRQAPACGVAPAQPDDADATPAGIARGAPSRSAVCC